MTVPNNFIIKQKQIDALTLYQQKIKELEESKFFNFYFILSKNIELKITANKTDEGWRGTCFYNEPPEEIIKAFILSFRFFIQKNEKCSIKNIGDNILPEIKGIFTDEVNKINNLRAEINKYLDSSPEIQIKLEIGNKKIEFKTKREIKNVFIFGHYAHATSRDNKEEIYDFIHINADEGMNILKRNIFRMSAINIILSLTNFLRAISFEISKILDKIVKINITQAEQAFKGDKFKESAKFLKNALYIANKLENKKLRAKLYEKLKGIYVKSKNEEMAKIIQNIFEEVKDSVEYLPTDFWYDNYYRKKYSLPNEYTIILNKILENPQDFSEIPIVVLPIEKIYQLKQFEKLIIAKNFKVIEVEEKIILYYEQIFSKEPDKSYWVHQKFEIKKGDEYLCRFPFLDDSGVIFITNSTNLFAKWFLSWLEIKNIIQNHGLHYILLQRYIDYLIDIEFEKEINLNIFNRMRAIKELESDSFSIKGPEKIQYHFYGLKSILERIIKISTYPRLKSVINLDNDIQFIKTHIIKPFLKQKFKGLKWFSFALNVILCSLITGEESICKEINDSNLAKLKKICEIINNKSVSNDFFENFFKFCDNYIRDYISNRVDPKYRKAWYNKGISSYILGQYEEAIEHFKKTLAIGSNHELAWFYNGISQFKCKRYEESIESYKRALEIEPNDKQIWFYKGISFFKMKKYEKSVECYEKVLEIDPKDSQTWIYKGISYHLLKKYNFAVDCFDKIIEYDPLDINAWNKKGIVFYDLGQYQKVIECCVKVLNIEPFNKQALYNKGISLINLEQYNEAKDCFDKILESDLAFHQAWIKLGFSLSKLKNFKEALNAFKKAIEIDSQDCDAWNNKGICFQELKQDEEAIISFNKVLEINSNHKFAWYNKGRSFYNLEIFQNAVECFNKALKIDQGYIDALINKGNTLCRLSKYVKGLECYNKALEIEPNNTRAMYNKGKVLTILERYYEALKCYDQFIRINQKDKIVWFNKGTIYHSLKSFNDAIKCYDRVIELDPLFIDALNNKGTICLTLNKNEEAVQYYNKALNINPNSKETLYNKSIVLENLERYPEALSNLDRAIEIDENYKDAWNNKGRILHKSGKYGESIKCINKVLIMNPNDDHALTNKAVSLIEIEQFEEAEILLDKAYQIDKNKGKLNYNKACIEALKNNKAKSLKLLKSTLDYDIKYKQIAREDSDFNNLRDLDEFKELFY